MAASVLLSGCNEDKNDSGGLSSRVGNTTYSVIGSVRPKADPAVMEKIRKEEEEARSKAIADAAAANQAAQQNQQNDDPTKRDLPPVDQSPISGIANMLGFGGSQNQPGASPSASMPQQMPIIPQMPGMGMQVPTPPPTPTASYGGYPSGNPNLIPPPPAVSLSTTAQPYPPPPANDPYAQAYAQPYGGNPYANAYSNPYMQPPQAPQPAHPQGSMFSNGGANSGGHNSSDPSPEEAAARNKRASMVVITPTGMEPRSPYKQRDDLKVLIKSAFAREVRDDKIMQVLSKTDVGLPAESTRGNISLTQRQIDNLFHTPPLDKKLMPTVKKVETDLAQAYYRYLYAFNRYSLTQQQVAARKQEVDMADSASERQRSATDLSAAQNDAESSKEDLRAAQTDLAALAGAQATRSIITKVTGSAPSLESLAVADNNDQGKKGDDTLIGNAMNALNVFHVFGKGKGGPDTASGDKPEVAQSPPASDKAPKAKEKKKTKKGDGPGSNPSSSIASSAAPADSPPPERPRPAPAASGITFELRNVQTTPRKSVLKVCIRNSTGDGFNLDPDAIFVAEGDHRLPDAAVRAEFDSTLVPSNQEITGTITIFGRPWNDKLSVSLSDGGKSIQLHR